MLLVFLTLKCNFNKKYNELATLLKFGEDFLKYSNKPNVLRNSLMVLGSAKTFDLTAATFFGSAV